MGIKHTIQHLEDIIGSLKGDGHLNFARRKMDKGSLEVWLEHLKKKQKSDQKRGMIYLAPESKVRMIRSSPLLSFISRDYQTMITPILYEKKSNGTVSQGKLHGGDFEYQCEEDFRLIMDMRREVGQELLNGKYRMITESITPHGVRRTPEGRVLQFFHARLDKYPTRRELGNPQPQHESFRAEYYKMEDLTRMLRKGTEDIRPETMEMIWLKYLWRKSRLVTEGATEISEREHLLKTAGLDLDPHKVLQQYRVYFSTPYITRPFVPRTKMFVTVGPFLWEKEMKTEKKSSGDPNIYAQQEKDRVAEYVRHHRGHIFTERILENHLE
ncbi:TPA: hypothetical protein HA265_02950 [Candidatus Woesearchaeota archaeon]|nr:hypothetical protein [Candidatus Woesearchaeota archaeon]